MMQACAALAVTRSQRNASGRPHDVSPLPRSPPYPRPDGPDHAMATTGDIPIYQNRAHVRRRPVPDRGRAPADGAVMDDAARAGGGSRRRGDVERALTEQRDKYLRLAAEYDNYPQAHRARAPGGAVRGQADMVKQLLDAARRSRAVRPRRSRDGRAKTVVQGAEMVEKKLSRPSPAHGLEIIDPGRTIRSIRRSTRP